jgi:inorganic pyrophosphatase
MTKGVLDRLQHYFLTYKNWPGSTRAPVRITHVYGRDEAHEVIRRSQEDYRTRFGALTARLNDALRS